MFMGARSAVRRESRPYCQKASRAATHTKANSTFVRRKSPLRRSQARSQKVAPAVLEICAKSWTDRAFYTVRAVALRRIAN
jgi:hypothetical protein